MIQAITDREYRVLAIIDKLRICRTNDLAWLAGYTDYSYCRKGIKKLENMRLIQSERDFSGAKCCFLTSRGLSRIEKATHHPYEISSTTNHALEVSVVCAWLCATKAANIFDMLTDSDLKRMYSKKAHCPDIVYDGIAYEIELNRKKHSVVESLDNRYGLFLTKVRTSEPI